MFVFEDKDRDKIAPKNYLTLYGALVEYKNIELLKIGHTGNDSFKGRVAWNEYINDCYHKFGFRGKLYNDEANRIKITEAVEIKSIVDEVQIRASKDDINFIEKSIRSKFDSYTFSSDINFSGKTEFVLVKEDTIETFKDWLNTIRKNKLYTCN